MLKILLRKQLQEVFRNYFFDAKKNKARSKVSMIAWFALFAVIMVGVLGGMFSALAVAICEPMVNAGMDWFYFTLMSAVAIVMGAFGSVFNTFSGLYLSKDNDLLLSLPIPTKAIIASRLLNVYLLGAMYSVVASLPAVVVYQITVGFRASALVGGLLQSFFVTLIVLMLSCVLGLFVAKISLKLKQKSFVTVLASLVFIGLYYFVYYKASQILMNLIANVAIYGEKLQNAVYALYLFGKIGEGDLMATVETAGLLVVLLFVTWRALSKSFLTVATASGSTKKATYREKTTRRKSIFLALLGKEFSKFVASPNYMLNCGLGVLFLPACGIAVLIKGSELLALLGILPVMADGNVTVLLCAVLCTASCMNDMVAPSVSLESKNLWLLQSMPVEPKKVLWAKASAQLLLTDIPLLFAIACVEIALPMSLWERVLFALFPLAFSALFAFSALALGLKLPILNWTSEIHVIKQSACVAVSMFGGLAYAVAFGGLYLWLGQTLGTVVYLAIWISLTVVVALLLLRWLNHKGSRIFATLM